MVCRLVARILLNFQLSIFLFIALCGCDIPRGLPYEISSVDKSAWPAAYVNAANDIANERCDEFVRKVVPFMSNGDVNAIYLMSQAMRKGLIFNEKTLSPAKHVIDSRQANTDILIFYAGLLGHEGEYKIFAESPRDRLNFIQELLTALGNDASVDRVSACHRSAAPQECYQHMVDLKLIPSLNQRIAELKRAYETRRLSATCQTGYNKIKTPH